MLNRKEIDLFKNIVSRSIAEGYKLSNNKEGFQEALSDMLVIIDCLGDALYLGLSEYRKAIVDQNNKMPLDYFLNLLWKKNEKSKE